MNKTLMGRIARQERNGNEVPSKRRVEERAREDRLPEGMSVLLVV
jgi:hypothetical protein